MFSVNKLLALLAITLVLFSCKNESNDSSSSSEEKKVEKKAVVQTPEMKKQINSVMTKAMVTPELKTFSSAIVSAGLTEVLSNEEGPFTLLAPSNDAFSAIDQSDFNRLLDPNNKGKLTQMLKNHIVKGDIDSATLVQNIKSGNGNYTLETLSGAKLIASMKGADIVIKDSNGTEAVLGKSDIKGSNGVVHVLDTILGSY